MEGQKLLNGYQTGQQTRRQGAVMFGPGRKIINSLLHLLKMAVLLLASLVTAFPFVWMIISALKTKAEIMDVCRRLHNGRISRKFCLNLQW